MDYIIASDGRKRKASYVICNGCGVSFLKDNRDLKTKQHFHSFECARQNRCNKNNVSCLSCGKEIVRSERQIRENKSGNFFCNNECKLKEQRIGGKLMPIHYGIAKQRVYKYKCIVCNDTIKTRKEGNACCKKCGADYRYKQYIESWKQGRVTGNLSSGEQISYYIRRYMFEKYNNKCAKCGWSEVNIASGKIPLTINHINGTSSDSREENLELICPNCHSLTSNYGSLNLGNGRTTRAIKRRKM
jgi:hypothetical protein